MQGSFLRQVKCAWQSAQQQAFDKLKNLCTQSPVLKFFNSIQACQNFLWCQQQQFGCCTAEGRSYSCRLISIAASHRNLLRTNWEGNALNSSHLYKVSQFHLWKPCHSVQWPQASGRYFKKSSSLPHANTKHASSTPVVWPDSQIQARERHGAAWHTAQLLEKKLEIEGLDCISMLSFVSVSEQRYTELQECSKNELSTVQKIIQQEGPNHRRNALKRRDL